MSRLGLGLGLSRGRAFSPFDPLSLNPIIAYEMHESMMAPLASESLDLDPANPSSLDIITATRAGTATYTDASGNIQTASPNTVRVDHVDGVPMILVEPAATNLVTYSEDFSQWITKTGATLTANYGISPDGTQNSTRLQFGGASKTLADNITTSSSSTGSVWVKGTAGETIRFGVYASESLFTLNGSWQRIQRQGTSTSNTITINTWNGATARDLEIWGGQLEDGTVATSYIPTSGSAVTRAADKYQITGSDFTNFFNSGGDGTFYAEFTTRNISDRQIFVASGNDGNSRYFYSNETSNYMASYDGANGQYFNVESMQTSLNRVAVTYNSSEMTGSLNGGTKQTSPHNGNLGNATLLNIGNGYGTSAHLNGHIKRLLYWPHHSDNL